MPKWLRRIRQIDQILLLFLDLSQELLGPRQDSEMKPKFSPLVPALAEHDKPFLSSSIILL